MVSASSAIWFGRNPLPAAAFQVVIFLEGLLMEPRQGAGVNQLAAQLSAAIIPAPWPYPLGQGGAVFGTKDACPFAGRFINRYRRSWP